jgi:hypothetical protein
MARSSDAENTLILWLGFGAILMVIIKAICAIFVWFVSSFHWLQILAPIFIIGWLTERYRRQICNCCYRTFSWWPDWLTLPFGIIAFPAILVGFLLLCVYSNQFLAWILLSSAVFLTPRVTEGPAWRFVPGILKALERDKPEPRVEGNPYGAASSARPDELQKAGLL